MHNALFLFLIVWQASPSFGQGNSSAKIEPTSQTVAAQQTSFKPPKQDKPPSTSFVPPTQSKSGGNSFNPQGGFVVPGKSNTSQPASKTKLSDEKPSSGFSLVNPKDTRPLRSSQGSGLNTKSSNAPPSSDIGIGSREKPAARPPSSQNPSDNFKLLDRPQTQKQSTPSIQPTQDATTGQNSPLVQPAQTVPRLQSTPRSGPYGRTPSAPTSRIGQQDRTVEVPSKPAKVQPTADTRKVEDATFDPQLKQITDLILTSVQRPNVNRLSLAKAVSVARDASHRKQIVKLYWTCFVTSADLQFAQQELQLLGTVPRPNSHLEQLLLRAATSSASARLAEAKLAYQKAASSLFKTAPVFDNSMPVSFADLPWVGKYKTNTDSFVKTGMFNDKIKNVDTALPALRDLIYMRGAAVYDNLSAFQQSIDGVSTGVIKLESVLRLHEETRDQRIEFLKNVQKYNHAIADYAITVFPNAGKPEVVANMLVDTKMTLPTDAIMDRNVRQASGNQPDLR